MPGSPVRIGPFTGGLNLSSDPTTIDDTECTELTNFDIDLDGSIVNRPPLQSNVTGFSTGSYYIGTFVSISNVVYFIFQTGTTCRAYDSSNNIWTTISVNAIFNSSVQYLNKLWLIADVSSATAGGSWDPSVGFTAIAAIARGVSACVYKERLFVATGIGSANPSRVNFSNAANFSTWTGTDFFDVSNGDGQSIVRIYVNSGYIVVFKQNSTYTYGYDSLPTKGITEIRSATIGIAGYNAIVEYENTIYIIFGNSLYSINSWRWDQVNTKLPFSYYSFSVKNSWENFTLSVVNNRLICRFYDNLYVYGLKTRAFSLWRFNTSQYTPSMFLRYPYLDTVNGQIYFVAPNYDKSGSTIFKLYDNLTGNIQETFTCSFTTKVYDMKVPYTFKRLFWWALDCLSKTQINFFVVPVAYNLPVLWSQLKTVKWSQVGSWGRPLNLSLDVSDSASTTNPTGVRTLIKLNKSLRYREISFKINSIVDGSSATGPLRIFTVTAFTSNKQLTTKKIS